MEAKHVGPLELQGRVKHGEAELPRSAAVTLSAEQGGRDRLGERHRGYLVAHK